MDSHDLVYKIRRKLQSKVWNFFHGRFFYCFGKNVLLENPHIIRGQKFISIFDDVSISRSCWLMAIKQKNISPVITINKKTQIGRYCHIVAIRDITIESSVLIADKVYISDNFHNYTDRNIPILEQGVGFRGKVLIKEGAWIGENVSIIGASIGKNSVVCCGAVVLNDVPDNVMVAGVPARIIKNL
ncbi:TPA: acyltransferase [Vibrio parahaemolyticus]|nr:acyltransferase [Vibrio parahaemolyticus]